MSKEEEKKVTKKPRKATYTKKCVVCGTEFVAHTSKKVYCSRTCMYQHKKKIEEQQKQIEQLQKEQKKKEEFAQIGKIQREQQMQIANQQTDAFVNWCKAHPVIVAGFIGLGAYYLNQEIKKERKKRKKQ
jgi:ribulose kinase